jgi:hypothetical protein
MVVALSLLISNSRYLYLFVVNTFISTKYLLLLDPLAAAPTVLAVVLFIIAG